MTEIIKNLYLGGLDDVKDYPKFDLVINLAYPDNEQKNQKAKMEKNKNTRIIRIGLQDIANARIDKLFNTLGKIINRYLDSDRRVLVHCRMGKSRSATIVIAYLMKKYKLSLRKALKYVQERRPIVEPNEGFMDKLKLYQNSLKILKN